MKTISVVVPVYNVENYLERCILSIINQTYQNLEIILVDDGSTDNSGAICDELALKDPRIKVIHKENGGLSDARNAGIEAASGEYIGFVDSDDYIAHDMYEKLLDALQSTGSSISLCSYVYVDEDTNTTDENHFPRSPIVTEVLSSKDALEKICSYRTGYSFYVTAWNKLYDKNLFNTLRFPKGRLHEDELTVHYLFDNATQVACISDVLYYYVQRKGSIMNTKVTVKSLDSLAAMLDRYNFYISIGRKDLAKEQLTSSLWSAVALLERLDDTVDSATVAQAIKPIKKATLRQGNIRIAYLLKAWFTYIRRIKHLKKRTNKL